MTSYAVHAHGIHGGQNYHALAVAREISGQPTATDFKVGVMEPPDAWPVMDFKMPGLHGGSGLTRDEARRLLEAMLLDLTEMPDFAR
jgi:hypothetical protein